jgi:hypothetical protein
VALRKVDKLSLSVFNDSLRGIVSEKIAFENSLDRLLGGS